MLFNSAAFAVFFVLAYTVYLLLAHRWQNRFLLAASLFFYAMWDWRFLGLLIFSITFDFSVALALERMPDRRRRRLLLIASLATSLALLGFFKYYNFFVDNVATMLVRVGLDAQRLHLDLVLPLGISFYTFHMMSYVIDVYHGKLRACRNYVDYALFVTFFPQLVAGPIARAHSLLPQVERPRRIDAAQIESGLFWIGWGLFKKLVIADGAAYVVNAVFGNSGAHAGVDQMVAVYAFALQIYGDFSGYSDMARGLAKMMGFELLVNFNLPYLAESPADFWRRWHISLSTWLRDYLYVPLGGNRGSAAGTYRNLFLTMLLGGIWHGASWTMVVWGAYHGVLLIAYRLLGVADTTARPLHTRIWKVILMFHLTCLGWLIFRADSLGQVGRLLRGMATDLRAGPQTASYVRLVLPLALCLAVVEFLQHRARSLELMDGWTSARRAAFAVGIVWFTLAHVVLHQSLLHGNVPFIYFQF